MRTKKRVAEITTAKCHDCNYKREKYVLFVHTTFSSHKCMLNYLLSPVSDHNEENKNRWRSEQSTQQPSKRNEIFGFVWLIKLVDSPINVRVRATSIYAKKSELQSLQLGCAKRKYFQNIFPLVRNQQPTNEQCTNMNY